MTNWETMKKHLSENVFSELIANGFTGKYPHFRKAGKDCIELVSFQMNKYGSSFTVEVSCVFPNKKDTNCALESIDADSVTVWDTNRRYRLSGMYDGWFYYSDLYVKRIRGFGKDYIAVNERKDSAGLSSLGYKPVQFFGEETAVKI